MFDYLKYICKQDQIYRELDFEKDNIDACFHCSKCKQDG